MPDDKQDGPGRPTSRTPEVVGVLVASFQNGLNITQACLQAGITDETYRNWCKEDPNFLADMDKARTFLSSKARQNLAKKINEGDEKTSQWWLERKDRREFATRSEHGVDVDPVKEILDKYGLTDKEGEDAQPTTEAAPAEGPPPTD